ncbi:hypothetical protein HOY80DRAFT_960537 [Tuber brumale]|nr:hypothetical protein HOY80DRAFT_960537 [Tuber brumale]
MVMIACAIKARGSMLSLFVTEGCTGQLPRSLPKRDGVSESMPAGVPVGIILVYGNTRQFQTALPGSVLPRLAGPGFGLSVQVSGYFWKSVSTALVEAR